MKNTKRTNAIRTVFSLLLACAMAFGVLPPLPVGAVTEKTPTIEKRDDLIPSDLADYFDESVLFRLPEGITGREEISVIIRLDVPSLMDAYNATDKTMTLQQYVTTDGAQAVRKEIEAEKAGILQQLDEQKIAYTLGEEYDTLLSGFEILLLSGDYPAVCKSLPAGTKATVGSEYLPADAQLVENNVNVYETGIFNAENCGYDGTGTVVAVLDTGVDSNHSAFSLDNFTSSRLGLTYDKVADVLKNTKAYEQAGGLNTDDVYINQKVPFGYDYADNDPDVYSTHSHHGTHVSGIIVGKDDVITGVAPNAQLVSMKIFSDVMDTARSSWILSALEDCVVLGVDAINMSLGTSCGFSRESGEELLSGVYDDIRAAGISLIVAASNSYSSAYGSDANGNLALTTNPDTATVGSPSTYEGALSVASINGVETPYILYNGKIIYFDESNDGASEQNHFAETVLNGKEKVELEYVLVPGVGRSADYTGMDITGKIALVRRGSNTFEEKALIAEAQGAAGIIIYNNMSGDIKMNVGKAKLAACSISQDDGELLAAAGSGKLTFSASQTSGPFMSDFSSWGPSPNLDIKPEITGHGGNIFSAITGGSYDRMSGTSMATPNMVGLALLLRQYVVENFPNIANDPVAVTVMVNRLLMSTADIVINTNGLPYAVRKQGAGLASIANAIATKAILITYDENGKAMDKTKLNLGDDPEKNGVYEMRFDVQNFGSDSVSYTVGAHVLTEGVSETLTNAGKTTITEAAHPLSGAKTEIEVSGGKYSGNKLTVAANSTAQVSVKITLGDEDKAYLNESFANGMYVEGFITLTADKSTKVNLSVPYLAFFGDWKKAPLFDKDFFETNPDELDDGIDEENKNKPDAYATRPIGGVADDYISYLGSYYFQQNPEDIAIPANREHIALSNREGSVHSLRFVWAGLLRNAERIETTITNDATGAVVYHTVDDAVRKSYGDGASPRPSNVEVEFDTANYNLSNNTTYTVDLTGWLDYGDGGKDANLKNTFSFPMTVDFEAPTVTGVEYSYEYDKTAKQNRLYARVAVYDNHYAMCAQLGYVAMTKDKDGNENPELKSFGQYMTPVYSQRNSTTYVTIELTDYIYRLKNDAITSNTFVLTCYDYALNYATFEIGLPDDFTDFCMDSLEEGLTLSPNEVYALEPLVYPMTSWGELLEFTSSNPGVVRVVNNKLVAVASGMARVKVRDPETNESIVFPVTVLGEGDEGYQRFDKPVADIFRLIGYYTQKAFYQIDTAEQDIGETGQTRFFEGNYELSLYPSETVCLNYELSPYFPSTTRVEFETSNENIVTVDEYGVVKAVAEGFASVTVRLMMDDRSTYYSETVSVEVKDPFLTSGPALAHYFGNGGLVNIPADLNLTEIGNFAFSNFNYVLKTPEELAFDDAETSKQWYIGDNSVTKVIIPEGIKRIGAYAFANMTALEEIVLPSTLEAIDYGAFYNCTSLQKITFSSVNNLKIINQSAFENCDLQKTVDLSAACMISPYAFAGNQNMEGIITSDNLLSIGSYAFAGCKKLTDITVTAPKVKYGAYAFTACESLTDFYVNASVLPEGMFYQCTGLEKVTVGPNVNAIGEFAFRESQVSAIEIVEGNTAFKTGTAPYVLSADGATLAAVAPAVEGAYTVENLNGAAVTAIGNGAFSHNQKITSVTLPTVTTLGSYAFGSSKGLKEVSLGKLTTIGEYAFFEAPITAVPELAENASIGKYAFSFTDLVEVVIPDGTVIAEAVYSECRKLESVIIGNNVTIGEYAFSMNTDNAFSIERTDNEDGERNYYYAFASALKHLTIGENAVIGENAFSCAASLEAVDLGENAEIGKMAFYNCGSLKEIDLSAVKTLGEYAFSGDVYYVCLDEQMQYAAVSKDGHYLYTYHGPRITDADLSAAESIGAYAFAYCRQLENVKLGDAVTELPEYAFAGCVALRNVNTEKLLNVGEYAFMENASLEKVDLSVAANVGKYAFVNCEKLTDVTLNPDGTDLSEGAFSYGKSLANVVNLECVKNIGAYAFAHTAMVEADVSGAEEIGDFAFLKEKLTPFKATLGESIRKLGNNPFAMCRLETLVRQSDDTFNGKEYPTPIETYDLSSTVRVIDGSLYSAVDTGLELIVFGGSNLRDAKIADGTVRVGAYAFAGSSVQMVTLPYSVRAIGHKAFYSCGDLENVVFNSYNAPALEEEFDPDYYESFQNLPGTGEFGSFYDYEGNEVTITGTGMLPFYTWNVTDGMYSNVFYGATFVDYVGNVQTKLTMVRPVNGKGYDSFIWNQYFNRTIDGAAAADDVTLTAINLINALPERVTYEHKDMVEAARAAYTKIATLEQQSLVRNYGVLISAEQRITALTPTEEASPTEEQAENVARSGGSAAAIVLAVLALFCVSGAGYYFLKKKKSAGTAEVPEAPEVSNGDEIKTGEEETTEE